MFLQVARDLKRFKGDDGDLRKWVFTIARHRLIDDQRKRARRPALAQVEVPDLPAAPPPDPLDPMLTSALGRLTEDQREVVALRFVADLSLDQVASLTKRSVGAVKALQQRGISQLARILEASQDADQSDD